MNIYIDESGSINNKINSHSPFVISLIYVKDKDKLQRVYKRFVSSNLERLKELDKKRTDNKGKIIKEGGKMFNGNAFRELKGTQFDPEMKRKFLEFFSRKPYFEVFYIRVNNLKITNKFCENTARCFNYLLRLAFNFFITKKLLPDEECILQLDERNERTETKYFLENYLNTELILNGSCNGVFKISYFDSVNNHFIQIADVFSNWYFSHLITGQYDKEFQELQNKGIIKYIFDFPRKKK